MEQEQQNENFDQPSPKNSLFTFFEIIRLKHIILFFLCLLFLGILVGGGSTERSPKRLSIKSKKCNVSQKSNLAENKGNPTGSIENIASKNKDKISKIGNNIKHKTGNAIENTNTSINEGKEKIKGFMSRKKQEYKNCNEDDKIGFDKIKPKLKFDTKNNSLSKGLIKNNEKDNKLNTDEKTTLKDTDEVKQNNNFNNNKSEDSKSIENEISFLKKEVKQLKNRINQLGNSSNKQKDDVASLSNDEDFISERIKFWQSVKENAQKK